MFPPPEAQTAPNTLWILKKAVYGLGDAGLNWYKQVVTVLQSLGGRKSEMDTPIFVFHSKEGELERLLSVHVDDFFYCGGDSFERVLQGIGDNLPVGKEKRGTFMYLGLSITSYSLKGVADVEASQQQYIESIQMNEISSEARKEKSARCDTLQHYHY